LLCRIRFWVLLEVVLSVTEAPSQRHGASWGEILLQPNPGSTFARPQNRGGLSDPHPQPWPSPVLSLAGLPPAAAVEFWCLVQRPDGSALPTNCRIRSPSDSECRGPVIERGLAALRWSGRLLNLALAHDDGVVSGLRWAASSDEQIPRQRLNPRSSFEGFLDDNRPPRRVPFLRGGANFNQRFSARARFSAKHMNSYGRRSELQNHLFGVQVSDLSTRIATERLGIALTYVAPDGDSGSAPKGREHPSQAALGRRACLYFC